MRWVGRAASGAAVAAVVAGTSTLPAAAAEPHTAPLPTRPAQQGDSFAQRGSPHHLAVVRPDRVDLLLEGRISRSVPLRSGRVSLTDLSRALPKDWLTVDGDTAVLNAAVVLVRGAVLHVDGRATGVRTLRLVGGATPADAASLHTGGGAIQLRRLTVESLDPRTGAAVAPGAPGRPRIVASRGGRLDIAEATIGDLGTLTSDTDATADAAVGFHTGSTGSVVHTTLRGNTVGLQLAGSHDVTLRDVTAEDSVREGVIMTGDLATAMAGLRLNRNGGNGLLVAGDRGPDQVVGDIRTTGNGAFGVAVVGQHRLRIADVTTAANQGGGLRIAGAEEVAVSGVSGTGQRVGVFTHASAGVTFDRIRTSGGERGLVTERSTSRIAVRDSTFTDASVAGTAIGGTDVTVSRVAVSGSRSGIRVERGATDVALNEVTVSGGRDGVVAGPATSDVAMTGLRIDGVAADGIRTESRRARITDTRIVGGTTGIDVAAATTITGTDVLGAEEGIRTDSAAPVQAVRVTVDAVELGVHSAPGSALSLIDSRVHAVESVRGEIALRGVNDVSLPPLPVLGAIGIPLLVLAFVLEEIHTRRQRRLRRRTPSSA